jgi:prepilin-type N-terminal cleavage/methylation domain-containing protein
MEGVAVYRVRRDDGFTLIELMFAMILFGLLVALAVPGWRSYQKAQELSGTARDLVSFLRNGQASAVSEETSYKAVFATDGKSVALQRYDGNCACYKSSAKLTPNGSTVTYSSPSFTGTSGAVQSYVVFAASGSASPGSVQVVRVGSGKTYTITVEGLTGRVSQ